MPILRYKNQSTRQVKHTRLDDDVDFEQHFDYGILLGKGSFGTVNEAIRIDSGEKFAVKVINKEKAGSAAVKLLEREVAIMKKVDHPNIIFLEEVLETQTKMYLVMELCSHGGLEEMLNERKYFLEQDVLVIMQQLADAIAYIHENDIVHRDLKLDNILLAEPTDELPFNVKLTDFGLSYTRGGSGSDYMMNQVVGTPIYMAPEVITNYGYSQQCDIWSLGVILFKLITGNPPFMSFSEEDLFDLIKKGELQFSHENWKNVSPAAKELVEGLMKVDPAHRLTSKEIVSHPWIKGEQEMNGTKTINVLEMMKEYNIEQKKLAEEQQLKEQQLLQQLNNANEQNADPTDNEQGPLTAIAELESSQEIQRKKSKDIKKTGSASTLSASGSSHSKKASLSSPGPSTSNNGDKKARPVPSYMQPTKSSRAPKNPNIKGKKK
eukprot:TCONS_00000725-protein